MVALCPSVRLSVCRHLGIIHASPLRRGPTGLFVVRLGVEESVGRLDLAATNALMEDEKGTCFLDV